MKAVIRFLQRGRTWVIGLPFVWLLLFFALPFLILLRISVTDMGGGENPFTPMYSYVGGSLQLLLHYNHYLSIFSDDTALGWMQTLYVQGYLTSLRYAFFTTVFCLVLGYPFAYFLARSRPAFRTPLLMLVMLPFWTSLLLRVYAWKGILADNGIVNRSLMALGVVAEPVQMLYSDTAMLIAMTYIYLPFMVLPLYANLVKMDFRLLEAAYDLGASPWRAFWLVTVPLSKAGIIAGCTLVFIPALGEFVIPSLLGGAENVMIGRVVYDEMFGANNWPRAAALAVVMILMILLPLALYYRSQAKQQQEAA